MAKGKKKKSKKTRNLIFIVIIVALVVVFAILGGNKDEGPGEHKLASYMKAEEVERGDIREVVSAQGPLQPYDIVHVRSEASGKVAELLIDIGDEVTVGDPLVELDQEILFIDLRRAEAAVEAARANLKQQRKGWLPSEKARIEEQIRSLEVDFNKYVTDLEKVTELHKQGFASDTELETAEYARDATKVALESAREQLEILLAGSPEEVVEYYEANYRLTKAEYDRAANALGEATIFAPMSGVILDRFVTEGSVVVSSQASFGAGNDMIALIGDLSKMKVAALVDETDIGQVLIGQKVIIEVDAFEDEEFEAEVTKINPMGNVTTTVTNFEVEMVIDNPEGMLLPNLTAYVDIVIDERIDVVKVPSSAMLRQGGKEYVFVVDENDILHQREIELGITDYGYYEVISGIEDGERIVVRGVPSELFEEEDGQDKDQDGKDEDEDRKTEDEHPDEEIEAIETIETDE